MRIVALVDDLMFLSRLREEARRAGADLASATTQAELVELLLDAPPALVIFDLTVRSADPVKAITAARAAAGPATRMLAYGPHGDLALLEAARAAGADEVLARGAFAARLPELLGRKA